MWLQPSSFSIGVLQRGQFLQFAANHKAFATSAPELAGEMIEEEEEKEDEEEEGKRKK